jgi:hypothetical protein
VCRVFVFVLYNVCVLPVVCKLYVCSLFVVCVYCAICVVVSMLVLFLDSGCIMLVF